MNGWISLYQILFGLITFPLILSHVSIKPNINLQNLIEYLINATNCQFREINSKENDNCNGVFWIFIGYQIIYTLSSYLSFLIIRKKSATIFQVVNKYKIPLYAWISSSTVLVGNQATSLIPSDYFSHVIIIVGIMVYIWKEELIKKAMSQNRILFGDNYNENNLNEQFLNVEL